MLVFHDEAEDAAAHTAAETMKRLPLRRDRKRWRFLLMKWTKRLEGRSRPLQWKIGADHLHDVIRARDLFDCLGRNRHFFVRSARRAVANLAREAQSCRKNRIPRARDFTR